MPESVLVSFEAGASIGLCLSASRIKEMWTFPKFSPLTRKSPSGITKQEWQIDQRTTQG